MLRDELRLLQNALRHTTGLELTAYVSLAGMSLVMVGGLVYIFAPFDLAFKHVIFAISAIITIAGVLMIYRHAITNESYKETDGTTKRNGRTPDVPPKPNYPPSSSAVQSAGGNVHRREDDIDQSPTEQAQVPADLYRRRFSLMSLVLPFLAAFSIWALALGFALGLNDSSLWIFFVLISLAVLIYCYYKALVWNGEELAINEKWIARPATMPWPLENKEPQILRTQINSIEIVESILDRLLKTCQLKLRTEVSAKRFEHIRWITYPDELRRALGKSKPRKNHFLFWIKRKD